MAQLLPVSPAVGASFQIGSKSYIWNGTAFVAVTSSVAAVTTGSLATRPATADEGAIYVVSGDATPANDGRSFIWSDTAADWVELSGADQTANDARYVNAMGDTMSGQLIVGFNPVDPMNVATKKYVDDGFVLKAGDTMTGPLVLTGNPTAALQAAPKQYVDLLAGATVASYTASANQSVANNAGVVVTFTDLESGYTAIPGLTVASNGNITNTSSSAMLLEVCFNVTYQINGSGSRAAFLQHPRFGRVGLTWAAATPGWPAGLSSTSFVRLNAGEMIQLTLYQNSGVALNIYGSADVSGYTEMRRRIQFRYIGT